MRVLAGVAYDAVAVVLRDHPDVGALDRILRLLGRGGFGEVYLAEDSRLSRPVAVKLLAQCPAADEDRVRRFRKEALAAYKLGRIATPEDVADLVCFLASARASFLTGICITVDGGSTRGVYP